MKVLLITNYPPDGQQSMSRYANMLESALRARGFTVETAHPPIIFGGFHFLRGSAKKWIGYIDKYVLGPSFLRRKAKSADIVHICDHSNSMYLKCAGGKPALITCHDLIAVFAAQGRYPGVHIGHTGRILQRWIAANLARAKNIVCVSSKTLEDVRQLSPNGKHEIRVIHHPLNWKYSQAYADVIALEKVKSGIALNDVYLLHVGGNQWYKNRLGVMQIFAELRTFPQFRSTKLIMAGKPWTLAMRDFLRRQGLEHAVVERVNVSNEELQALYSGAQALLFPSLEEGFGWPLLEAQACGCPVITSNRAPMTEIAGEAAIYIDPGNPKLAAKVIAENASRFEELQRAGIENLRRFSYDKVMDSYIELYGSLLYAAS
jgi:glycosyltransferase involved in cell wall biosynthesis